MVSATRFLRRLFQRRLAAAGGAVIVFLAATAILAPLLAPYPYMQQDLVKRLSPPSAAHWLGTDGHGRDVLSRVVWGTRLSLLIGIAAVLIVMAEGTTIGVVAGHFGGRVDWALMRFTDAVMSIPALFVALIIVAALRPSAINTVIVIGAVYWPPVARVVRAQVLAVRQLEFTEAAKALGASNAGLICRHLLPNTMPVIIVQSSLSVARAILVESGLSFLGVGVQPPIPTWGNMLAEGRVYLQQAWWIATFPGISIFLAVFGFNLFGDGLREVLDPRLR